MNRSPIFVSLLLMLAFGLTMSSCNNPKTYVNNMPPPPPPAPEVVEEAEEVTDVLQESLIQYQIQEGPRTVVGSFRSVKGIMDPLSCYCNNSGYVETPSGESVPVCFKDDVVISTRDYIEVTGIMTTRSIDSNGTCPSGVKTYLIVESFKLTM